MGILVGSLKHSLKTRQQLVKALNNRLLNGSDNFPVIAVIEL